MDRPEGEYGEATTGASTERVLRVVFEVELSDDCSCPVSDPSASVEDVHNHVDDGVCHAEVTVADGDDTKVLHATNQVEESCLCHLFGEVGCVPRMHRADDGTVLVETYVSDRTVIGELVERLKRATERVSLRQLTTSQRGGPSESTTVDLSSLTTKQREAVTLAVSEGYYETPRQASLDELAGTLKISKSALSQRLSGVESKLVTAAFDP